MGLLSGKWRHLSHEVAPLHPLKWRHFTLKWRHFQVAPLTLVCPRLKFLVPDNSGAQLLTALCSEMSIYRNNLSAIIFYRLSLSLKIILIYRLPLSLLLYFLLSPINHRDKRFSMHAVFKQFSLSELPDSFSFLFLYYNGHASILIDQLS